MKENNIYVIEYENNSRHFVIVVAASNHEVARQYVKELIGINEDPTWLMNAKYPIIYSSDGSIANPIQAKILYNGNNKSKLV